MERALHVGREAVGNSPAPAASPALSASAGRRKELGDLGGDVGSARVDDVLAGAEAQEGQHRLVLRGGRLQVALECVRHGLALQPLILYEDLLHDLADPAQGCLAGVREPRHGRAVHCKRLV